MISNSDGLALKAFLADHPNSPVSIDPNGIEVPATANELAGFSSFGPATGTAGLKPDLLAVGTNIYMAAENYDPLGALYGYNGVAVANGTSFATPLVSGAAALVLQSHPHFTASQVRSALVDTASQDVLVDDSGNPVTVQGVGAGKLDAGAAVASTVTSTPATLSFGAVTTGTLPQTIQLQITNGGTDSVSLAAAWSHAEPSGATLSFSKQNLTLSAGATDTLAITLAGTISQPGAYSGALLLTGSGVSLRIPYSYLVGNGVPANLIPLTGMDFDGTVGQQIPDGIISFRLVDAYGLPVSGVPVSFSARGGGSIQGADQSTDEYGVAAAVPVLGSQAGTYSFIAVAGGLRLTFTGTARQVPTIASNGVADAATFATRIAPGSYISIFGSGLSDFVGFPRASPRLPLAIDYVNVSFDVPAAGISVPGHLTYASPTQVNVQVPWELEGQPAAQVKVTIDFSNGNVVSVPLSDYAPAFFETSPGTVAAQDASYRVINSANPAQRGQTVMLYANGLGPVSNQPSSGDPAPYEPLARTKTEPLVMIGNQNASVAFSGLTPGFAGLYQVNVVVPSGLAPGTYPVTVAIGGVTSAASGIVVQ